jgi:hypothetical protein
MWLALCSSGYHPETSAFSKILHRKPNPVDHPTVEHNFHSLFIMIQVIELLVQEVVFG